MRKDSIPHILFSVMLFVSQFSFAQKGADSRFFWGGNLGLMFGTYTVIDISPEVGYKVTEKFHIGTGFTYTYYKYTIEGTYNGSTTTNGYSFSTHIYGGRVFSRYYVLPNLFLHAEDEFINLELPNDPVLYPKEPALTRQWLNSVLVGGGYGHTFNVDGPAVSIAVLFRVTHNKYDDFYPYQNPIIRIGLGFGF